MRASAGVSRPPSGSCLWVGLRLPVAGFLFLKVPPLPSFPWEDRGHGRPGALADTDLRPSRCRGRPGRGWLTPTQLGSCRGPEGHLGPPQAQRGGDGHPGFSFGSLGSQVAFVNPPPRGGRGLAGQTPSPTTGSCCVSCVPTPVPSVRSWYCGCDKGPQGQGGGGASSAAAAAGVPCSMGRVGDHVFHGGASSLHPAAATTQRHLPAPQVRPSGPTSQLSRVAGAQCPGAHSWGFLTPTSELSIPQEATVTSTWPRSVIQSVI